jgi:hypothetical protein
MSGFGRRTVAALMIAGMAALYPPEPARNSVDRRRPAVLPRASRSRCAGSVISGRTIYRV